MTAQFGEKLIYKVMYYHMATGPLRDYLIKKNIQFVSPNTACCSGYYSAWAIKNDKLFLIELIDYIKDYKEICKNYLFHGIDEVFAYWFTGTIRFPIGKSLEYIHLGYCSTYEKDLILHFDKEVFISGKEINNKNESTIIKSQQQ